MGKTSCVKSTGAFAAGADICAVALAAQKATTIETMDAKSGTRGMKLGHSTEEVATRCLLAHLIRGCRRWARFAKNAVDSASSSSLDRWPSVSQRFGSEDSQPKRRRNYSFAR
jgi:hypothetical protein